MARIKLPFIFILLFTLLFILPTPPVGSAGEGWLVVSRRTESQADLWAMPAEGGTWQRLTDTAGDERWPTWHPDGHTLAYAARRDNNWDIYLFDLRTGEEERLTTDPHFDGWPAWAPDGKQVAFASSREQDLDLFLLDPKTKKETNLTLDSAAHDFEPSWLDNEHLLFVSTRNKSHDVFRYNLEDGSTTTLTASETRSERHPLGIEERREFLAIIQEGRPRHLAWVRSGGTFLEAPFSWNGAAYALALSPQKNAVVWLEHRLAGDLVYKQSLSGGTIEQLNGPTSQLQDVAWGNPEPEWMAAHLHRPVVESHSTRSATASDIVELQDVETVQPRLNEQSAQAFQTLRARVERELGRDFLGTVGEMIRPLEYDSEESDYLSWHKAGRSINTVLELERRGGTPMMEIVREDWHHRVYWRIWLRCPIQDGSCGEPLVAPPWDLSYQARWEESEGEGGQAISFRAGYYVDFTRLATDEGWQRLASYESPEFDWRDNKIALEYWQYLHTERLSWYAAMSELYTPETLQTSFDWSVLREKKIPLWQLRLKEVPLPAELRQAPAMLVQP